MHTVAIILIVFGAMSLLASSYNYARYRFEPSKRQTIEALAIVAVVLIFSGIVVLSSLKPIP